MKRYFFQVFSQIAVFSLLTGLIGCGGSDRDAGEMPITSSSSDARELFYQGLDHEDRWHRDEAHRLFEKAIDEDSTFALAYLALARNSSTSQEYYENLEKAHQFADGVSEAERGMIEGYYAAYVESRPQKGEELMRKAVQLYPEDEHVRQWLADFLYGQGKCEEAIEQAREVIRINPDFGNAYNLLGYAYHETGNLEEAESAFKAYVDVQPTEPNPYDSYGDFLLQSERYEEAAIKYRDALETNPDNTISAVGVAAALNFQERHDEARDMLRHPLERLSEPDQTRLIRRALALSYIDEGKLDPALAQLDSLHSFDLAHDDLISAATSISLMGDLYLEDKRPDLAAQMFDSALALALASGAGEGVRERARMNHRYHSARVAIATGNIDEAARLKERHLADARRLVNPTLKAEAYFLEALIALSRGEYQRALNKLGQADPDHPRHQYQRALALLGLGEMKEAQSVLDQAISPRGKLNFDVAFVRSRGKGGVLGF